MLNVSENSIKGRLDESSYKSLVYLSGKKPHKKYNKILLVFLILAIMFLFLPWTQHIHSEGILTTLTPDQRPQTIHTIIDGRIEKWFVNEGDYVKKGDTILFISEIKDDYFDPNLLQNTDNQIKAKHQAYLSYGEKANALESQIRALEIERKLKIEQAINKLDQSRLKVISDSMDLVAVRTQLNIANIQYNRADVLNAEGLKAVVDVENNRLRQQDAEAKIITQENKLLVAKNELINARIELNRIRAEYDDKISKARSDQFTAFSSQFDTEAQVNKLENQLANYIRRNEFYYITSPQDGFVNRALQSGIGETIKVGTQIVSIMPAHFQMAVETFVDPMDVPLVHRGEHVRIWFDGFPTIVFRGWPDLSYGTFGGTIVAVENFISDNGKYRVLIEQDPNDKPWPKQLAVGAGAQTLALLQTVPIWFELWRKLNGFPQNYYQPQAAKAANKGKGDKK